MAISHHAMSYLAIIAKPFSRATSRMVPPLRNRLQPQDLKRPDQAFGEKLAVRPRANSGVCIDMADSASINEAAARQPGHFPCLPEGRKFIIAACNQDRGAQS